MAAPGRHQSISCPEPGVGPCRVKGTDQGPVHFPTNEAHLSLFVLGLPLPPASPLPLCWVQGPLPVSGKSILVRPGHSHDLSWSSSLEELAEHVVYAVSSHPTDQMWNRGSEEKVLVRGPTSSSVLLP